MESPTSPNSESSKPSSPTAQSNPLPQIVEDFLSDPLEALVGKPFDRMSEDERREAVLLVRNCRQSYQTFKAKTEEVERARVSREPSVKKTGKLGAEFNELFG